MKEEEKIARSLIHRNICTSNSVLVSQIHAREQFDHLIRVYLLASLSLSLNHHLFSVIVVICCEQQILKLKNLVWSDVFNRIYAYE